MKMKKREKAGYSRRSRNIARSMPNPWIASPSGFGMMWNKSVELENPSFCPIVNVMGQFNSVEFVCGEFQVQVTLGYKAPTQACILYLMHTTDAGSQKMTRTPLWAPFSHKPACSTSVWLNADVASFSSLLVLWPEEGSRYGQLASGEEQNDTPTFVLLAHHSHTYP